jgi:hypothetical protein
VHAREPECAQGEGAMVVGFPSRCCEGFLAGGKNDVLLMGV